MSDHLVRLGAHVRRLRRRAMYSLTCAYDTVWHRKNKKNKRVKWDQTGSPEIPDPRHQKSPGLPSGGQRDWGQPILNFLTRKFTLPKVSIFAAELVNGTNQMIRQLSAIQQDKKFSREDLIKEIVVIHQLITRSTAVTLQWVPSHVSVRGVCR